MHRLFTNSRPKKACEPRKSGRKIKAIHDLRGRIIHRIFRPETPAVNKFSLELFRIIALDSGILKVQVSGNYATDFRG
jgi:hypothetical protein